MRTNLMEMCCRSYVSRVECLTSDGLCVSPHSATAGISRTVTGRRWRNWSNTDEEMNHTGFTIWLLQLFHIQASSLIHTYSLKVRMQKIGHLKLVKHYVRTQACGGQRSVFWHWNWMNAGEPEVCLWSVGLWSLINGGNSAVLVGNSVLTAVFIHPVI